MSDKVKRTATQIAVAMSEKRSALNEALKGPKDGESAEDHGERRDSLVNELAELEPEYRAALVLDATAPPVETRQTETVSAEERERRELRGKVSLSKYVGAAIEQRASDGPEAEYNAAAGLAANAFPLELLAPAIEERATTDTEAGASQATWLDRLFANTAAMSLGISFQSVAPGVSAHPVTTAGAAAAQRGRAEAAADAAWTVGVTEIKPTRNAVRAVFSEEDSYRLPGLEEALRRDLSAALTEGVDRAVFVGDAGANEDVGDITGLTTAANVTEATLTQANKVKGPNTLAAFTDLVDGIHANGFADLRVVAAVGAWRLWESTIVNAAADNMTLAAFLRAAGLSWRSRGSIENATTNGKFAAFIGRNMGIGGAGVAAVWNAGMLLRDPYSGAAKGEVALTLSHFWGLAFPRPANFSRIKFVA